MKHNNIKKIFFTFTFIIVVLFNFMFAAIAYAKSSQKAILSISGSHTVIIENDMAIIHAHIETFDQKAKNAVRENADIMEKIRKALKKEHMDPKKLVSKGYNLKTNYDYIKQKKKFRDYQVIHRISVTTKDINKVGHLTDLLISSGANHISNIEFKSSKAKEAYDAALKNAVKDAQNKAKLAISGTDSMSIGKAVSININPVQHHSPPIMYRASSMLRSVAEDKSAPTHFNTEGQKITVNVHTTWEIKSD